MSRSPSPPSCEASLPVLLPVGKRKAALRRLSGEGQLQLLNLDFAAARERLLSQALACVVKSMSVDTLHNLTLPDRHALVRAVLVLEGAAVVEVTAVCPGCERQLELSLDLRDIELPELPPQATVRAGRRSVRLPRPADLEAAVDDDDLLARLGTVRDRKLAEEALAAGDPLADLEIGGECPECGHAVSSRHDIVAAWLHQLRRRASALLGEVHLLASRYHWSEQEILNLPEPRRGAYIDLCREPEEEFREEAWP